jgi:PilZ domain-containing protein
VGQPVKDRRSDPRLEWASEEITRATLRPGCTVHIVDVSAGGALLQTARPLRPGARVHFQIVTKRRAFSLVAKVLRCEVWMLDSLEGIIYRGALQFEQRCDFVWEADTPIESVVPEPYVPAPVPAGR